MICVCTPPRKGELYLITCHYIGPTGMQPVRLAGSYRCWFVYVREKYCWLVRINSIYVRWLASQPSQPLPADQAYGPCGVLKAFDVWRIESFRLLKHVTHFLKRSRGPYQHVWISRPGCFPHRTCAPVVCVVELVQALSSPRLNMSTHIFLNLF